MLAASPLLSAFTLAVAVYNLACGLAATFGIHQSQPDFFEGWYLLTLGLVVIAAATSVRARFNSPKKEPFRWTPGRVAIALSCLAWLGIWAMRVRLGTDSTVSWDEVHQFLQGTVPRGNIVADAASGSQQPPLDYYYSAFGRLLFGRTLLGLRFHAMLFGGLSIPLFCLAASAILTRPASVILATGLYAMSPVVLQYTSVARPYSIGFFYLSLLLLTLAASVRGRFDRGLVFANLTQFLCSLGIQPLALVASLLAVAFLNRKTIERYREWIITAFLALAVHAPLFLNTILSSWFLSHSSDGSPGRWPQDAPGPLMLSILGELKPFEWIVLPLFAFGAVESVLRRRPRSLEGQAQVVARFTLGAPLAFAGQIFVVFAAILNMPFLPRYAAFLIPIAVLASMRVLDSLPSARFRNGLTVLASIAALAMLGRPAWRLDQSEWCCTLWQPLYAHLSALPSSVVAVPIVTYCDIRFACLPDGQPIDDYLDRRGKATMYLDRFETPPEAGRLPTQRIDYYRLFHEIIPTSNPRMVALYVALDPILKAHSRELGPFLQFLRSEQTAGPGDFAVFEFAAGPRLEDDVTGFLRTVVAQSGRAAWGFQLRESLLDYEIKSGKWAEAEADVKAMEELDPVPPLAVLNFKVDLTPELRRRVAYWKQRVARRSASL